MKRLLVLGGIAASLVLAGTTNSARPPSSLLTFSVQPQGGLCVARPDGTRRVRLIRGEATSASWSPSGRLVAFARGGRIVIANARGQVVRQFGSSAADPAWSPDGSRIAYSTDAPTSRIVIASPTGRTLAALTAGRAAASSPSWSPNAGQLAYAEVLQIEAPAQPGTSRIVVVNADGTGRRVLIGLAAEPAWAPDGSRIAYVAFPTRLSETGYIAVVGTDGAGSRRVTSGSEPESGPSWSPRGRMIAFTQGGGASSVIGVVSPNGSGERVLVRSRSYGAFDPAWRPPSALPKARRAACS